MSFLLKSNQPIRREVKQLVRHQLRSADKDLRKGGDDAVHEARKRVKKVKAIVTLLQQKDTPALGHDERRLRAAGQVLSALRDSDAVIETFDALRRRFPRRLPQPATAMIRGQLVRARTRIAREAENHRRVVRVADTLVVVRQSAKGWKVPAIDAAELPELLKASYRASRKAMHRAQQTTDPADLHRWRKRVKTLWYQLRMIQSLAPGVRATIKSLEQLEEWLGEHQNLSVLQAAMTANNREPGQRSAAVLRESLAASRGLQKVLRRRALALGRRQLTARPKAFARTLRHALSARPRTSASTRRAPTAAAA